MPRLPWARSRSKGDRCLDRGDERRSGQAACHCIARYDRRSPRLAPCPGCIEGKGIRQDGAPTPGCIVSEDAFIKEAAATALGQFRDPRVIPDLIMLLKDGVLREKASAALATIGDTAIEPLIAFLYDPKASEVVAEGERVLSYASVRLTAKDALRQLALETLEKLGWIPSPEDVVVNSSASTMLGGHAAW